MKTADLSLIETIGDYASKLIAAHPSLRFFGKDLSTEDLGELTSVLQTESSAAMRCVLDLAAGGIQLACLNVGLSLSLDLLTFPRRPL